MTKASPDADMARQLRKARARVTRTRRALREAQEDRWALIRAGLAAGMSPAKLSKETGLHVSRIHQIGRGETGEEE